MPTFRGLDMQPTLEWYEANIDEVEDRIHECFLHNRHRLPVRIEKALADHVDGVVVRPGMDVEINLGLHRDDLAQVFSCFNPGFWQRSNFAKLYVERPLWFTESFLVADAERIPTKKIEEALSPTHCIPGFTGYRTDIVPDRSVGYGSFVYLYELGCDVSPDVRRVVAIECLLHELTHTLVQPILSRKDIGNSHVLRGMDSSEFDLWQQFNKANDELDSGISQYSDGCRADHRSGPIEEFCEATAAYLLRFSFRGQDNVYNFDPFDDRNDGFYDAVRGLLNAYVA